MRIPQRFDRDHAVRDFVVAKNQRKARAAGIGPFELGLHAAQAVTTRRVHHHDQAQPAQGIDRAQGQWHGRWRWNHCVHIGRARRSLDTGFLQQQQQALDAEAPAYGRSGLAAQLFDQRVVTTTAAHRAL